MLFAKLDANDTGKVSMEQVLAAIRDFWLGSDPEGIGNFTVGRVR